MSKYMIKIAETEDELNEYFRIRHEVFVKEQQIFSDTDVDEKDDKAIHIIEPHHYQNCLRIVAAHIFRFHQETARLP